MRLLAGTLLALLLAEGSPRSCARHGRLRPSRRRLGPVKSMEGPAAGSAAEKAASNELPAAGLSAAEKAASNERLVAALFGSVEEASRAVAKDPAIASHMQLDLDDDGETSLLRFAFVDEHECIGCTYCADVARNTFFMEESAGRARVFAQGQDDPEVVMEAIDCCPVNCISFVDLEDLVTLECEREGITINQRSSGTKHGDNFGSRRAPSKAKGNTGAMCCNNCPSKGCKACPMYGVGQNPVYLERLAAREEKREASGEAAAARFDDGVQSQLDALFDARPPMVLDEPAGGVVVPTAADAGGPRAAVEDAVDALYGGGYAEPFDDGVE